MPAKKAIQEHYDLVTEYYEKLWGEHVHHGYFLGDESKEQAQIQLLEQVFADTELSGKALDIGCGTGATCRWLTAKGMTAEGITLSPKQGKIVEERGNAVLVGDVEKMQLEGSYDIVCTIEMLSHLHEPWELMTKIRSVLRENGTYHIAAWVKNQPDSQDIAVIEQGMMVTLPTIEQLEKWIKEAGFEILCSDDVSAYVAKTWDISWDLANKPQLWKLAATKPGHILRFMKTIATMRRGFRSETFAYYIIKARASSL